MYKTIKSAARAAKMSAAANAAGEFVVAQNTQTGTYDWFPLGHPVRKPFVIVARYRYRRYYTTGTAGRWLRK